MTLKQELISKLAKIQADLKPLPKNQTGSGIKYKFRSADQIYSAIRKHLSKAGIMVGIEIIDKQEAVLKTTGWSNGQAYERNYYQTSVHARFTFTDGDAEFKTDSYASAGDYSDKWAMQAMTQCIKYMYIQVFNIETGEHDPDATDPSNQTTLPTPEKPIEWQRVDNKSIPTLAKNWAKVKELSKSDQSVGIQYANKYISLTIEQYNEIQEII